METPEMSMELRSYLEKSLLPASRETIMDWLHRLAGHKRMHSDGEGQITRIVDYSDLLFGVTEHALVLAVIDFIESYKSSWFPTLAELKEKISEYEVTW